MSAAGIALLTHFPSPYQVELFDEVERVSPGALSVYYLHKDDPTRSWNKSRLRHAAKFIEDEGVPGAALAHFESAGLAIFNYYAEEMAARLLRVRARSGKPWAFWGERPGYRHPVLGALRRRWVLRDLHRSRAPIWGIGQWAVDAYREEFGGARAYANIPYFSSLERFQPREGPAFGAQATFLYSGSLIRRKGVDLLAKAFVRASEAGPIRLRIMGSGELEGSMRQALAPRAANVEWVGFKHWTELPAEYATARFLCVPSRYDGWGLVVAEGLAAGLPVIATDRMGAALDLVRHGKNGWIVPAGDEDALAGCMLAAARMAEPEWRAMSADARASVEAHTLENGARRLLAAANAARAS